MAILYIAGYAQLTQLVGDAGQMPDENTKTEEQTVAIGAAAQSVALNPGTKYVRLHTDAVASILVGFGTVGSPPNPQGSVSITNQRFAANQTEFKGVPTNGNGSGNAQIQVKIACITNTGSVGQDPAFSSLAVCTLCIQ
jgi:hypothetical protein